MNLAKGFNTKKSHVANEILIHDSKYEKRIQTTQKNYTNTVFKGCIWKNYPTFLRHQLFQDENIKAPLVLNLPTLYREMYCFVSRAFTVFLFIHVSCHPSCSEEETLHRDSWRTFIGRLTS